MISLFNWYIEFISHSTDFLFDIGLLWFCLFFIYCAYAILKANKIKIWKSSYWAKSKVTLPKLWERIKYPTIWFAILATVWAQVSFIFYVISVCANWHTFNYDNISDEFGYFTWICSYVSELLIIIASYFIWLSFGNKFIRAIGDFIYLVWLLLPVVTYFIVCWYQ